MIVFTTFVIMGYALKNLITDGPVNNGFKIINTDKLFDMIGFSFYSFEGIGCILPVLKESKNP